MSQDFRTRESKASIILPGGKKDNALISDLSLLGRGRAAEAWLVDVQPEQGHPFQCVEKRFAPGGLTRFIYSCFFQSPFPYSTLLEAALCCLYRRKVAERILTWDRPESAPLVADSLYVRLMDVDEGPPLPVLGTTFIKGVGLRPPKAQARWFRKPNPQIPVNREMAHLATLMSAMEERLLESGLVGSGWQVSKAALVTPANFLFTEDDRFICIDLESGIPALLVPRYLFGFLKLGVPLFDDTDCFKLRHYILLHEAGMRETLGNTGYETLIDWVDLLEKYHNTWKGSEFALFRHRLRLLKDRELKDSVRKRLAEYLLAHDRIDEERSRRLRHARTLFFNRDVVLSMAPTGIGRGVHRLVSNREFRARVRRMISDQGYRRKEVLGFLDKRVPRWLEAGRISSAKAEALLTENVSTARALGHGLLSNTTPRFVHRMLTDGAAIPNLMVTMMVALFSKRFQYAFARHTILAGLRVWEKDRRLTPGEAGELRETLEKGEMQEYLRCFGMHLCIKILEPLTSSIKVIGFSLFALQKLWAVPIAIVCIFITSVIRTLYTLWRMLVNRGRGYSYATALGVGIIPAFGSLAYPFQMYRTRPALSTFLLRDFISRGSQHVPIYGGKYTFTEMGLLACSDRVLLVLDGFRSVAIRVSAFLSRTFAFVPLGKRPPGIRVAVSMGEVPARSGLARWWNKAVETRIKEKCPEHILTPAPDQGGLSDG